MNNQKQEKRLTLTVTETARLLGLSRNSAYEAIRTGQIPSIRIGRRIIIPRIALDRLLDEAGKNKTDSKGG